MDTILAQMIDLDLSHLVQAVIVGIIGFFLKGIMDDIKEIKKSVQRHAISLARITTRLKIEDEEENK